MIGWRPKTFMICSGLVLLVAIGSELYKLNTELKYGNLGSDPHWVRPTPTTFDAFVLGVPVSALIFMAVVLLVIGIVRKFSGSSD